MLIKRIARSFAKFYSAGHEALADVKDGAVILTAGFGLPGVAENCLRYLKEKNLQNLTFVANSMGLPNWGHGVLINRGQVSKIVCTFIGGNPAAEKRYLQGKLEINFIPQGQLVEKMRLASIGVAGFYTPTGYGTIVESGGFPCKLREEGNKMVVEKTTPKKEVRIFDGRHYILEEALQADFGCVRAFIADKKGNLRYRRVARNFNPSLAGAAKVTIAEAEHIIDELPPDKIHTPACLVDRFFEGDGFTHKIERLKIKFASIEKEKQEMALKGQASEDSNTRVKISKRAAKEFKDGMYVNLGVGIPAEIPSVLSKDSEAIIQAENGLVNAGDYPEPHELVEDIINASKETVTAKPGFSISSSSTAFGMMRGNHLHMTVLGGLQVSEDGDLANWFIPGKKATGMGGAMDLAACVQNVVVVMEHTNKGKPRILPKCDYPPTALKCVKKVITELAVFDIVDQKLILIEKDPKITLEELKKITPANYTISPNLRDYQIQRN